MVLGEFKLWWREEKFSILLTLFAGILPLLVEWIFRWDGNTTAHCFRCCPSPDPGKHTFSFEITPQANYAIQSIFIFITSFVLIRNRAKTRSELSEHEEQIKQYMARNCRIKMYNCKTLSDAFKIVKGTIGQFYDAWLIVWILWFAYYFGCFLLYSNEATKSAIIFGQVFDFLSSSIMLVVYLILTTATVNVRQRKKNDDGLWYAALAWMCIFTLCLIGIYIEGTNSSDSIIYKNTTPLLSLMLSVFSAISFILVLGKMNSNFLRIPKVFLFGLYFYAIAQAYVPFDGCKELGIAGNVLQIAIPYITLIGKIFVMLTLCWIVAQKRLIFFVIHQSVSIEEAPILLNDLNKEIVKF